MWYEFMDILHAFFSYLLHIDQHLFAFVSAYGPYAYIVLFLIVFCETGLVVTPFLPGDSLLFAAGSIAANTGSAFHINLLFIVLFLASTLGNKMNYLIGKAFGARISRLINKGYLRQSQLFYARHGGKTIIFARFIPIIRTFAPFVAGISNMNLRQFTFYNLISAALWVGSLLAAGYIFGSIPIIKANFSLVIYTIILLSLLPPIVTFCQQKIKSRSR